MSQQSRAKDLRKQAAAAVQAKTDEIRNGIITEMLASLYRAPLWFRLKWAFRIVRGDRRESLWMHRVIWTADWLLERFTRWAGDKMWSPQTCGTCTLGWEGTCNYCAGDNYGHTTEIWSKSPACTNWKKR